ncbi:MAG: hypothetical protein HY647_13830 [Acidobacteria bacterium]|nr:hypothetical protein [Acidobacteriota bacterium]
MQSNRSIVGDFFGVTAIALALYLPFRSVNYDLNGIYEALAIEAGARDVLLNQNHLLYRPLGYLVYKGATLAGYQGKSLPILQIITALYGALGIGFAYLIFLHLGQNRRVALLASLWLATSWSYWYFSSDVAYIPLAVLLGGGAVAVFIRAESNFSAVVAGVLASLAILSWQANILLIPVLVLYALLLRRSGDGPLALTKIGILLATCLGFVSAAYGSVGVFVFGLKSPQELFGWLFKHGSGSSLPMWGRWELSRISYAGETALASILPLNPRLVMGEFADFVEPEKTAFWWSLPALIFLGGLLLVRIMIRDSRKPQLLCSITWVVSAYAIYFTFIVWWDPFESKWFLLPNLFLGGLISVICSQRLSQYSIALLLGCILAIATANFVSTIWPRHSEPKRAIKLASCVSSHMNEEDLFLATDWGWTGYLGYFHERSVISFIDEATVFDKESAMQVIQNTIVKVQQNGGKIYMLDLSSYADPYVAWLQAQTGFTKTEISQWVGEPAHVCDGIRVQQLSDLKMD